MSGLISAVLPYVVAIVKIVIVVSLLMLGTAILTWVERKALGFIQLRHGPLRVGWHGILQPIADGIKAVGKEMIIPGRADKPLFILAPVIALVCAVTPFTVVPWGKQDIWVISDLNIGLVFILALSSLGTYGVILGGWASNSKYSVLGALRATAQMISYELPLILALVGPLMLAGTLSLRGIVEAQAKAGVWFVFLQPIAFICYILAGTAETQRVPFDMLEDEGTLVTGFFTEYSGTGFALFAMAEYINMILIGVISAIAFLGGWQRPFPSVAALDFLSVVPPVAWLAGKAFLFVWLLIWLRGTLPRVRYDQLMYFGWKVLLPLTLLNILLTGLYKVFDWSGGLLPVYYGLMFVATVACLGFCTRRFYEVG